jgi:hypothetical protein
MPASSYLGRLFGFIIKSGTVYLGQIHHKISEVLLRGMTAIALRPSSRTPLFVAKGHQVFALCHKAETGDPKECPRRDSDHRSSSGQPGIFSSKKWRDVRVWSVV